MNPLLARLQPYPFERLRQLFAGVTPNPALRPISLGIGEPDFRRDAVEMFSQDADNIFVIKASYWFGR